MASDELRIVQTINAANYRGFEVLSDDKHFVDVYAALEGLPGLTPGWRIKLFAALCGNIDEARLLAKALQMAIAKADELAATLWPLARTADGIKLSIAAESADESPA